MTLTLYFFRQFIPPFVFGTFLFLFVMFLNKLFDLIDLIFNKGVQAVMVGKLFLLFLPTIIPLIMPMAILLACVVAFGRMSEENELTAVRAGGISLLKVFWLPPLLALVVSFFMVPFNTQLAPQSSQLFRKIYEEIAQADPLVNIEPKKFFSIKNIRIYTESIDKKSNLMRNVLVFQNNADGRPTDRIFAQTGSIVSGNDTFTMVLGTGQLERFDTLDPKKILHITFGTYRIQLPLKMDTDSKTVRFRNVSSQELKKMIQDMRAQGLPTAPLQAEDNLRYAIAFAPLALTMIGIPLATVLKRGGRTFSFGITLMVTFAYYTMLVLGLTLAEKGILPPLPSLWIANILCFILGLFLFRRMIRQ